MSNSNLFKAAHKLTRLFIAEFPNLLDYRASFSYALKALHMQATEAKNISIIESDIQIKKHPHIFKKSSVEIWKEKKERNFFWNTQVSSIKKSFPSEIAKNEKRIEEGKLYYKKGQGVTMC